VRVDSLAETLGKPGYGWLMPLFELRPEREPDRLAGLNIAFASDGAVIDVPDGAELAVPIHVVHVTTGPDAAMTTVRNLYRIGAGARCDIVESYVRLGSGADLVNATTEISLGADARVTHVKHVEAGSSATHVGSWQVGLGARATYRGFQLTSNTGFVRNQTFVTYQGEGGKLDLSGVFLARGSDHIDTTLVVDHAVPGCESRELFKGVMDGRSRGVFQGKIIVRPDAQKTDGKQMAQALMLSDEAEFDAKPELEIYADDVVCGHGATSAELDPDMIFYCQTRGIPPTEATALLTTAFVAEAIDKVEHEGIREALKANTERWLGAEVRP
jgi:Fe-S cluster assembly protein SufD